MPIKLIYYQLLITFIVKLIYLTLKNYL